ncbi:hypothetical protein AVEN_185473-1 [Araneus ventricosus]|uniref:Transposase Tc1-like domain-containing protein n=1 Tax=Araneus ventricosus TaxID=182803 RepID=A0A4Y2HDJ0_ARAVE|nr:hypothetical protein AVEN_185473-1 [Araneus ventricosus]
MGRSCDEIWIFGLFHKCTVNIGGPVKHQISAIGAAGKKTLKKLDHSRQTRILKRDRRTILSQIAVDFNDGASTSVSVRTVQRTVINMGSQS